MNAQELKDQILRLEGFSDGIKQGAMLLGQWIAKKFEEENKKANDASNNSEGTANT